MVLDQIQPICVAERKFLNSFFHFERGENAVDLMDETGEEDGELREEDGEEVLDDVDGLHWGKKTEHVTCAVPGDVDGPIMLNQLFGSLLRELEEFIDFAEKLDS